MVRVKTSAIWQLVMTVPENVQGYRTDHMTWGKPDAESRTAGLRFTGTTTEAPLDGHEFTVGQVTVDNFAREQPDTLAQIPVRLDVHLEAEGGPSSTLTPYLEYFAVDDTDHDSPDTLLVHRGGATGDRITLDGASYGLVLTGFPTGRDEPPAESVHVPEGQSVTVELKGMLVTGDGLDVAIRTVRFQGDAAGSQSDEYIELVNRSVAPVAVGGWVINAGDAGQDFTFPEGATLTPGLPVRVHTGEVHPAWGGYSFGRRRGIWSDKGDAAELRNAQGTVVARYAYGNAAR